MTACTGSRRLALQEAVAFAPHAIAPIVEQIADRLLEGISGVQPDVLGTCRIRHLQIGIDRPQAIGINLDADSFPFGEIAISVSRN